MPEVVGCQCSVRVRCGTCGPRTLHPQGRSRGTTRWGKGGAEFRTARRSRTHVSVPSGLLSRLGPRYARVCVRSGFRAYSAPKYASTERRCTSAVQPPLQLWNSFFFFGLRCRASYFFFFVVARGSTRRRTTALLAGIGGSVLSGLRGRPVLADWGNAYYGKNFQRLREVKHAYNPEGKLGFPQSIPLP